MLLLMTMVTMIKMMKMRTVMLVTMVVVVVYCLKYKVHSCWKQRRFYHNLSLNMSKPPLYDGPNVDEARYVAQTVSEMVLV